MPDGVAQYHGGNGSDDGVEEGEGEEGESPEEDNSDKSLSSPHPSFLLPLASLCQPLQGHSSRSHDANAKAGSDAGADAGSSREGEGEEKQVEKELQRLLEADSTETQLLTGKMARAAANLIVDLIEGELVEAMEEDSK